MEATADKVDRDGSQLFVGLEEVRDKDSVMIDIQVVRALLDYDATSETALETMVRVRRLEAVLGLFKEALIEEANKDFMALRKTAPTAPYFDILGARVETYTTQSSWEYSEDTQETIEELKARIKAFQEVAKNDGTANKKDAELDPATQVMFSVSVKDCL